MRFNYSDLNPDLIMDALDLSGLRIDSGLIELNSYENRVYQFQDEDRRRYVVKFYRPGRWSRAQILEEHDFAARLNEAEIPVAAPSPLPARPCWSIRATPSPSGRAWGPPVRGGQPRPAGVGGALSRPHPPDRCQSPFHHRVRLDVESMLHEPRQLLASGEWLPSGLAKSFFGVLDELIKHVSDAMTLDVAQISLHGDCHPGNILWRDGPMFVDLDDCRSGPAIQDLWMMLSGERHEQLIQLDTLLAGYEEFMGSTRASWR
ncbi:serine/threonine protein kinase [Aeromonas hydrophila]|uniref:Serine/threonine protein kinase n=1 Tax=Aeromonas hydrophila TaxID=644 RepID=A0A926FNY9_AERHY|nr:serine/threonine protein kinase [Aeromonas hydrophila]